jgi:hypothetical protein
MSYKNRKPVEIKQTVPEVIISKQNDKEPVIEVTKPRMAPPEPVRAPRFEQAKETPKLAPILYCFLVL